MTAKFGKVLVANRGEIACRILRSVHALGYRSVAVYSDADADAPHVTLADEAVPLGGQTPAQSYLDLDKIIAAATATGADALHPGYGFLAENPALAKRCVAEGIAFVGPPAAAITVMGDKVAAKRTMIEAQVPCIPGYLGDDQDPVRMQAEAAEIGLPVLVKAVAGGGGRGMRIVRDAAELDKAIERARSEAASAFGRGDLFLERVIEGARHVEIQVFADAHGNAIHLGERDCSAQRRHQKIVEEAPCPAVDADLRARMGKAAVAAAKAVGYVGAGTVEFLLDEAGCFYFLEMNTRLQVEHPVTEMVTGIDLVRWQLEIAAGATLPCTQDDIELAGHAIEVRVYAEDPYAGFLPATGTIAQWQPPTGPGIRVDHGLAQGQEVSPFYDPMLAKVIAHGSSREVARRRLRRALADLRLRGVTTNVRYLGDLLECEAFVAGEVTTDFVDRAFTPSGPPEISDVLWALAAVMHAVSGAARSEPRGWTGPWRSTGAPGFSLTLQRGELRRAVEVQWDGAEAVVSVGDAAQPVRLTVIADGPVPAVIVGGVRRPVRWHRDPGSRVIEVGYGDESAVFEESLPRGADASGGAGDGRVLAPTGGKVLAVEVAVGDRVAAGGTVAIIEAMKLEHRVVSAAAGEVEEVLVAVGDQVSARAPLCKVAVAASE